MSNYQYIVAKTIIAENTKRTQNNKHIIRRLGKAFVDRDWDSRFAHHAYWLWSELINDTRYRMRDKTRAMHMVCAYFEGKKFTQVEQQYYPPVPERLMYKENDKYSKLFELRLRQIEAIRVAKNFLSGPDAWKFDKWIRDTGMKNND